MLLVPFGKGRREYVGDKLEKICYMCDADGAGSGISGSIIRCGCFHVTCASSSPRRRRHNFEHTLAGRMALRLFLVLSVSEGENAAEMNNQSRHLGFTFCSTSLRLNPSDTPSERTGIVSTHEAVVVVYVYPTGHVAFFGPPRWRSGWREVEALCISVRYN